MLACLLGDGKLVQYEGLTSRSAEVKGQGQGLGMEVPGRVEGQTVWCPALLTQNPENVV